MKILWLSFWGSWTEPLLQQLSRYTDVKLGILIPVTNKKRVQQYVENVDIFQVFFKPNDLHNNMSYAVFSKFKKIIDDFAPDVIHVHGTEKNLSQVQNFISDIPVIISIQGILMGYRPFSLNFLEKKDYVKYNSLKNFIGYGGTSLMKRLFQRGYKYEPDIFSKGKYFIGRTDWDRAHVFFRNPHARYFQGEELLRNPFYERAQSWSINTCEAHSIFMPTGFNPIKGLHWAVEAVALLKKIYPKVKLIVPGIPQNLLLQGLIKKRIVGENYINYIINKIKTLHIKDSVVFLPNLTPAQMAEQMQRANVFLSPSSIDNSPNAIGEAMTIGVPVVSTPVGGVTSFLQDNDTCLLAPSGDPYLMAFQVKQIFDNKDLACSLSKNAYQVARRRHDVSDTGRQYIQIYQNVLKYTKELNESNPYSE